MVTTKNNSVLIIKDGVLIQYTGKGGTVTIPDGVCMIGPGAFSKSGLEEIIIPGSVKSIASKAFEGCNLISIIIPEGVELIGEKAFSKCEKLTRIELPNSLKELGENAFFGCKCEKKVYIPSIEWWLSVKCSGYLSSSRLFTNAELYANGKLVEIIEIPDGIEEIPSHVYEGAGIIEVVIPKSVKKIGSYAFRCCNKLTRVNIPYGVEEIEIGAFSWCSSLSEISLPESISKIGSCAFQGCSSLKEVTYSQRYCIAG